MGVNLLPEADKRVQEALTALEDCEPSADNLSDRYEAAVDAIRTEEVNDGYRAYLLQEVGIFAITYHNPQHCGFAQKVIADLVVLDKEAVRLQLPDYTPTFGAAMKRA